MKVIRFLFFYFFIVLNFCACKETSINTPISIQPVVEKTDFKMLFVGNSYTFYNDGVDYHLQKMLKTDKSADSINYTIQKVAVSSYTLNAHYNDPLTLSRISGEKWDVVVLQEQSTRPINNPDLFLEYATKLDVEIKNDSAETVLFMTWAEKLVPSDMNLLADEYQSVGVKLNAQVVPVGKVWEYVLKNYPQINLYISDNKHPTLSGTYLIACTFYYSLFKLNPEKNSYVPNGMSTENVLIIRRAINEYYSTIN